MKDFFVSYNKADKAWAEWIAWQLEEAGHTTVLQAWDFRPGSNFVLEMQRAASKAERTVAVLSPEYVDAEFTQPEWAAAFAQDPSGEKGTLLPVRVRECDLEGLVPQIIYVDLVGLTEEAARDTLLAGVQRERAKPEEAPPFPVRAERSVPEQPRFPGALPAIWNVTHRRNPNFTGRDRLLKDLRAVLTSWKPAALTQAITGLGGAGKTQLALEYAYRHAGDYAIVWWLRAEEPAKLAADYAGLAESLGLPEKDETDQRVISGAVRRWLQQNSGWLLVLDNARDPGEVRDYLPQAPTGHVIITSRNPNWGGIASPLPVPVMERPKSVEFLLKRTDQDDEAAADALAEALGDLPLALEQAGAYMESTGRSLPDYLALFRKHQARVLKKGAPPKEQYPGTVMSTWELALQEVREACPPAADLLNLCAFLAPDDIAKELLVGGAEHLPKRLADAVGDSMAFDEAVAALRRYSLVEVAGDALSVHRLVLAVTRDRLTKKARQMWAKAAVRLVNSAFPYASDDVRTWPVCARLLPHALVAVGHSEELEVALEHAGGLLNQVGVYLMGRAQSPQARAVYERALAIDEAAYGQEHPTVGIRVSNLGSVLQDLGDLEGARAHYERALAIDEAAYGPNHPEVATDVNNLGSVLQGLGDLEGARAHSERALAIDEAAYGQDHPTVAIRVNNLGGVLRDFGDLKGAKARFERALAIDEAAYGRDHPKVAIRVNNLGSVLRDLGDLKGAKACFERALAIDEAARGPNHPSVAIRVNNLGSVLHALGELKGARAHYERALAIFREFLGEEHSKTVAVRGNLESLGRKAGGKRRGGRRKP